MDNRTEAQASQYVLGALPPYEARAFEAAMRADPKLRLLVKELRGTTGGVVTPNSKAASLPLQHPNPTAFESRSAVPSDITPQGDSRTDSWVGWMPWALAACFAILCVTLIAIGRSLREQAVSLRQQVEQKDLYTAELQQQLEELQAQTDRHTTNYQMRIVEMQKQVLQKIEEINRRTGALTNQLHKDLGDSQRRLADYRRQAEQLQQEKKALEDAFIATAASDRLASSRIVVLRPTADGPPGALGASIWSPQDQRGLIVLEALPPPQPPQVYQLWLIDAASKTPISAGVLQVGPGGTVRLQFAAPSRIEAVERFAISVERVGGVPAPTGRFIMLGN
jgi:anti-sigma-K factor RskA